MARTALPAKLFRDRSGVAAVEFALVLPLLLTMWLGMESFSEYASADARTLMAAQSVSNLTAMLPPSDPGAFTDIAAAAGQIMAPLSTKGTLTVDIAGVVYDTNGNPTMTGGWRCTSTGGPAADASVPLDYAASLGGAGQMTIMVNVKYAFAPAVAFNFLGPALTAALGPQVLSERAFSRPRSNKPLDKPC